MKLLKVAQLNLSKLVLLILFFSNALLANTLLANSLPAKKQIELIYSAINIDYESYGTYYGYAIAGEFSFDNGLFVSGFFNETDFIPSGPDAGNANIKSWLETGIGYAFDHEWGEFYSLITYETVSAKNKTSNGFGAHFGFRKKLTSNLSAMLQFGHIDTEFSDKQLQAKLYYKFSNHLSLSLGIRDYDDWDYTSYETSLVYRF